jgi:hypothetical protein
MVRSSSLWLLSSGIRWADNTGLSHSSLCRKGLPLIAADGNGSICDVRTFSILGVFIKLGIRRVTCSFGNTDELFDVMRSGDQGRTFAMSGGLPDSG